MIPETQLKSHQPQISTYTPPIPPKTTTVKHSIVNIQFHQTSIPIIRPKSSIRNSSINANFTKASHDNSYQPQTFPQLNIKYPSPHHWTRPSNHTPPSMATQSPLSSTSNVLVQTHFAVPSFKTYTLNVSKSAPLSSQLQIFDGTDYRYRPKQLVKGIKADNLCQLGPEPTSPDQRHVWHVRRMALVAISSDIPASSWLNSLSEADLKNWSTFTMKFLKQFDSVTAQNDAQAEAQNKQLDTHESIFIYACSVEDLVNKRWPENDAEMHNREIVNFFIQGLPLKLGCSANEKKFSRNLTPKNM